MKDDEMPTEHCRVGVYHKMAMEPACEGMEDEQAESEPEEDQD